MLPFSSLIQLDRTAKLPIYQQITNQIIDLIRIGTLQTGQKIISTRQLSELLGVHRKTVNLAYEDLLLQGWFETKRGSGTFIAKNLPEITPTVLQKNEKIALKHAGFEFEKKPFLYQKLVKTSHTFHLDDGFPDPYLAPLEELSRAYRSNLLHGNRYQKLGYNDTKGSFWLRQQLAIYLNETRGLKISPNNILMVRGTIMGFHLAISAFVSPNDYVVMGQLHWSSARISLENLGAKIITIPVDENGLVVEELEKICEQLPVRFIYVTPHHHYPTTVTLKADRRIKLLKLAQKYRFIVFEDDYDYDFHYLSRPLLPLASADETGVVLYSGSFTKSISPAFRVGYLVASEEVIEHLAAIRRFIDRQGDTILENAIAELLQEGIIQKYVRKSLREYRERRDFFCGQLQENFRDEIQFQKPEGGMAVWARFSPEIDLIKTAENALKQGLYFSDGTQHNSPTHNYNATRLGFASSRLEDIENCIKILKNSIIQRI